MSAFGSPDKGLFRVRFLGASGAYTQPNTHFGRFL